MPIDRDNDAERQERLDWLVEENRVKEDATREHTRRIGKLAEVAPQQVKANLRAIGERTRTNKRS